MKIIKNVQYYLWATFQRKNLDKLNNKYKNIYHGVVLDIGGRDRGKFKKPKDKVAKWIFADIQKELKPDIVMNISDMHQINDESIDVISAIEVFEYVEKADEALSECHRILKPDGYMILSSPFLCPIADDPVDLQRWTKKKWENELNKKRFNVEIIKETGYFFTILADMLKTLIKSFPIIVKQVFYLTFPVLDLIVLMDKIPEFKKNSRLKNFVSGYFIIAKKHG